MVEAILGGRQPPGLQLHNLLRQFPVGWQEQELLISGAQVVGITEPNDDELPED